MTTTMNTTTTETKTSMENTMTLAISKDENTLVYDWAEIDRVAAKHAIVSDVLRDFAFENVTDEMSAQELVDAYFAWLDAEKEAVQEAIYPLQCEWFESLPKRPLMQQGFIPGASDREFEEPTTDRTDEIIARHIEGINHPGEALRNAVFAAMAEWQHSTLAAKEEAGRFSR